MKQLGRIVKWAALAFCVVLIAIQFVPLNRTNPPVQGDFHGSAEVVSVCVAHATTVIRTKPCGRGMRAQRRCHTYS